MLNMCLQDNDYKERSGSRKMINYVKNKLAELKELKKNLKIENDYYDFDIERIEGNKVFLKDGKVKLFYAISSPKITNFEKVIQEKMVKVLLDSLLEIEQFSILNKSIKDRVDTSIEYYEQLKSSTTDKTRVNLLELRLAELNHINNGETITRQQTYLSVLLKAEDVDDVHNQIIRYFKIYSLRILETIETKQLIYSQLNFQDIDADITAWKVDSLYDLNTKEYETYFVNEQGKYVSFLVARDFKSSYNRHGFLTDIVNLEDVYFSQMNINSVVDDEADTFLSNSLDNLEQRREDARKKSTKRKLQSDIQAMNKVVTDTYEGAEKMVLMELYFCLVADTKQELSDKRKAVLKKLKKYSISATASTWEQKSFFLRVLTNDIGAFAVAPVMRSVAGSYPLASISLRQKNGAYVGVSEDNQAVFMNLVKDELFRSWNMIFFGRSRSGKSSSAKVLMEIVRGLGFELIIIDPQNEYYELTEYLGGKNILSSELQINVHDLMQNIGDMNQNISLLDKNINRILLFYKSKYKGLTDAELGILKRIELQTYQRFGITRSTTYEEAQTLVKPVISDVFATFKEYKDGRVSVSPVEMNALFNIEQMLSSLTTGREAEIFNQQTNKDIRFAPVTTFAIKDVLDDALIFNSYMYNVEAFAQNRVYENRKRGKFTIEVVDEGHRLLDEDVPDIVKRLAQSAKEFAKFNAGLWFITQNSSDVFEVSKEISKHALGIMSNSTYLFLMNMADEDLTLLNKKMGGRLLAETDIKYVRNANVRQTLLFVNNTIPYRFTFTPNKESFKYYGGA